MALQKKNKIKKKRTMKKQFFNFFKIYHTAALALYSEIIFSLLPIKGESIAEFIKTSKI